MEPKATETIVAAIAPQETVVASPEDAEARFTQLEAEKENYRKAYLKEAARNREPLENLDDEGKMEEVARRVLADSRIAEIAREQDAIIKQALKENKELKLAHLNKDKTPPAAIGASQETTVVKDCSISPDQLNYFKNTLHWTDKEIEHYKRNLGKRI